ncbi:ribokinase [Sedimentibacter sp. zth1]|uniref:ribokinase n=1 Tax=Sedimentibacter sp. zth1 TaxID=2816908 RepID=UPI001A92636C|nr:ribokinase [Sedimentibacter sp. zth1]QSX04943.1 ribokinase [Sedimentibacter sp. zth1]
MNKIVVVGSINTDLVFTSNKRPNSGETIFGNDFKTIPGGKGANQAVAASKLNAQVIMIGCVGNDLNGDFSIENFKKVNVNTSCIKRVDSHTGVANIVVAENDNSIIVVPGANYKITKSMIDEYKAVILSADIVLLQLEIPLEVVEYTLNLCDENNIKTVLNPAPAIKLSNETIAKSTFLTPNEHECKTILGLDKDVDIVEIIKQFPNKLLITLGEKGVMYFDGENVVTIPAYKVKAIDTTGAGDTFNGAFARAIVNNFSIKDAINFANKASSISVTKFGAQGGMPILDQID